MANMMTREHEVNVFHRARPKNVRQRLNLAENDGCPRLALCLAPNILGAIQEQVRRDPGRPNVLLATASKIALTRGIGSSEALKGGLGSCTEVERLLGCMTPAVGNSRLAPPGSTRTSRSAMAKARHSKVPPEAWP